MIYSLLILLAFAVCGFSQPWQWELYEGDYYNPTGFPAPILSGEEGAAAVFGNFDGEGTDELFMCAWEDYVVAQRDSGVFHWTSFVGTAGPLGVGCEAANLDTDESDELIVFGDDGVHVWEAVLFDPWEWQQRDDLLEGFDIPEGAVRGIYGDYDGDGLLNAFYWSGVWDGHFELWERTADQDWAVDTSFDGGGGVSSGIYDGDFDHDGDTDIAIAPLFTDVPLFGGFGENTAQGIVWHLQTEGMYDFPGPTGGDIDGDGVWKGLYAYEGYSGFTVVEVEHDSLQFLRVAERHYVGGLFAPIIGNFRTGSQTVVGAVRNWSYGAPFYHNEAFACMSHSDSGWRDLNNNFEIAWDYNCVLGNKSDLNGDGLDDILSLLRSQSIGGATTCMIWRNTGDEDADAYVSSPITRTFLTRRFMQNPDTLFQSHQIGDVSGDGRAELGVLATVGTDSSRILFFEKLGEIEDTTFVARPEWCTSLPGGMTGLRLADIDNDGLAEIIAHRNNGSWRTFFRRNGVWQEYSSILPTIMANDVSFADADNDGDLDLFAGDQLWYSLSPSNTDYPFILQPSAFSLSAYPNPFNSTTTFTYDLPQRSNVELTIFNLLGEQVAVLVQGAQEAGAHTARWQPSDGVEVRRGQQVSSGIYFAKLSAGTSIKTQKVVYLR